MTPDSYALIGLAFSTIAGLWAVFRHLVARIDNGAADCEKEREQLWERSRDHFAKQADVSALTAKVDAIDERTKEILRLMEHR